MSRTPFSNVRRLVLAVGFLIAFATRAATVKFVTPLNGSQAFGPMWLEVTTDATSINRVEFSVDGTLAGVARNAPWRITHDFGSSMSAHTITAKVFSNDYHTIDIASVKTAALSAAENINVDLVEVPMRVRASHTVTPNDLRVRENRVDQVVRDVKPERGAAHFVFVVDRSLSMGDGRLESALAAIDSEIHALRPDDTASIVLFNHVVSRSRPIARSDKVAAIFGDVVPSGGTSLHDALASIATNDRTYAIV